eukprot:TRINITY_DN6858_c0_g1_i4.p1 TRINITY_DN6858_c0_g1~~TRINITY_DN6858_c0_g1_i4.p1  ORF type:complete len:378 (+),score=63.67 TRINITY_DN6858_c0_g1_i4:104-1237(+)
MANRTMLRQCLMQQSRALSTSSRLTHAAPTSSQAAPANPAPGLGLGEVRTGIERIHRVKVDPPAFLSVPKTCAVIGAPFTYGQPVHGVDNGPEALREAGLMDALTRLDWRRIEHGDLKFEDPQRDHPEYNGPGRCHHPYTVGKACEQIADAVSEHARAGRFVLTLGGDHSIGMGTVGGVLRARPDTGVLWIDAHADINTPEISGSGNMHGMPLSLLANLVNPRDVPGCEWIADLPPFDPSTQLVYVGLRDVDKGERDIIHDHNIKAFTMSDVDRYGIGKVMDMALEHLKGRPLHLSYDIDACDPAIAPSTGTAVRGGLTYREAHFVAEAACNSHMLGSMDMVEVNPNFHGALEDDLAEETVELGLGVIASALGNRIL